MTNYNHNDYMPPQDEIRGESTNLSESKPITPTLPDPEIGIVKEEPAPPQWATFISIFFSPLLIPTYCVALAMWITPLVDLPENIRMVATLMVLLITAVVPAIYLGVLKKIGVNNAHQSSSIWNTYVASGVFIVCELMAAYYLYYILAPEWLFMIPASGAVSAICYLIVRKGISVSEHLCGMGMLCAVAYYIGVKELATVNISIWLAVLILLSGLVGSARSEVRQYKISGLIFGFIIGAIVTYLIMNFHIIEPRFINTAVKPIPA